MSYFRFKHFIVSNERSAMKVNTDGVLLGAFAAERIQALVDNTWHTIRVIDAGTGTGTVALMLAQRLSADCEDYEIIGADIDLPSVEEAAGNFKASPWSSHLHSVHCSFDNCGGTFSLIVSNPPYFQNALPAPEQRRSASRHASRLSYDSLLAYSSTHLSENGSLCMVLPASVEQAMLRRAAEVDFFPQHLTLVRTMSDKEPSRILVELKRGRRPCVTEDLAIREGENYGEAYRKLVSDYYLWA